MDICYQQVVKKPALGKTKGKTSVFNDSMSYACSSHLVELKVFILRMVNLQVSANFNKETTNSVAAECCLIGTYWNDLSWSIWRGSNPNESFLPEQFTNLTWWASYFWFEDITTWSLNLSKSISSKMFKVSRASWASALKVEMDGHLGICLSTLVASAHL